MRTLMKMAVVTAAVVAVYSLATQAPAGVVVYWNVGGPRAVVVTQPVVVVPQTVVAAPLPTPVYYYPSYGYYYPYTPVYAYYPPAYYPQPYYYAPPISLGFGFSFGGHRR